MVSVLPCRTWDTFDVIASNSPAKLRPVGAPFESDTGPLPASWVVTVERVDRPRRIRQSALRSLSVSFATTGPVLAVAIDSSRLAAGIVDTSGDVLVRDRVSTPTRDVWRSLEGLVGRVVAARPPDARPLSAVGVSCIGPVDVPAGSVSPSLVGAWSAFPLRQRLEVLTGLPVVLDTAAGAASDGERWLGDAVDVTSHLTVMFDQTVESACVIGGRRMRGGHGNAGSIAHVTVDPGGNPCRCGGLGCLEAYASSTSIEAEINRPLRRATPSIVGRTGIMIGRAIASATAIFDVRTVFVSGLVIDTFGDPVLDAARHELRLRSNLEHLAGMEIREVSGRVQPLVGAASLVLATTR